MTGISSTNQAKNQVQRLLNQQTLLDTLATQLATGKKTQNFAGLGSSAITSMRARASLRTSEAYINNITHADYKMQMMLQAINEIDAQATNMSSQLILLSQESAHQKGEEVIYTDPITGEGTLLGYTSAEPDVDLKTMQDMASSIYEVVVDLMNSKNGEDYLLSGADSGSKPLTDTGLLDAAITARIQDWKDGIISNEELIADLTSGDTTNNSDAINDTIIGYSANLSADTSGELTVRASETIEVEYTVRANEDPFRNILVSLAFLKNETLTPVADVYTPPNAPPNAPDIQGAPGQDVDTMKANFYEVLNAVSAMLEDGLQGVDAPVFKVEMARARLDSIQQNHVEQQSLLASEVSDVEDVNIEDVAVKISSLQTQLEASYAVTASVQQLSLVNFL